MEGLENQKAARLRETLNDVQGVVVDSAEKLFVVTYPKEEVAPLLGFTKKDLEAAIELKLLAKASYIKISGKEYQVYMKAKLPPV